MTDAPGAVYVRVSLSLSDHVPVSTSHSVSVGGDGVVGRSVRVCLCESVSDDGSVQVCVPACRYVSVCLSESDLCRSFCCCRGRIVSACAFHCLTLSVSVASVFRG